jgi:hypothetical protein
MREKKATRPPDRASPGASRWGAELRRRGVVESIGSATAAGLGRGEVPAPGGTDGRLRRSRSQRAVLLWPLAAAPPAGRGDLAVRRRRPARQRDHHPVLDWCCPQREALGAQSAGQAAAPRCTHRGLLPARQASLAHPDRAHVGPFHARHCRTHAPAQRSGGSRPRVRLASLFSRASPHASRSCSRLGKLIMH